MVPPLAEGLEEGTQVAPWVSDHLTPHHNRSLSSYELLTRAVSM